jgi:hypothetical protein
MGVFLGVCEPTGEERAGLAAMNESLHVTHLN